MTMTCGECGNTTVFRRIYDAKVTVQMKANGKEVPWNEDDVEIYADADPVEQCDYCGSETIETE